MAENPKERLALIQKMFADAYGHGMKKTIIFTTNQNQEIDQYKQLGCEPVCLIFMLKKHMKKEL